ncbi:hypothetical protein KX928_17550 [Roseobacter sp. YSTF-M11]|uniref:Uncharacterized protein n=1 Tax=Roseobacter insulae TaxID=2859783 RepID=A0A9X1FWY4_9RHOB|nr:hypothetical protein [Roseobacter insulae]MBW4709595.1 hypothetical protein [Roseobacter insulae]
MNAAFHLNPTRAEALTSFANPKLLHFLAAAATAEVSDRPLARVAGLDGANLMLFRAAAIERGFLDHGTDRVTRAGCKWAAGEFAPFAALLAKADRGS